MNDSFPASWVATTLDDINTYVSNSLNPMNFGDEIFELYSVPSFPNNTPEILKGYSIGSLKQTVQPDDVLVCKINPKINRVWQVKPASNYKQIASSEWIVIRTPGFHPAFLRYYFASPAIRELIVLDVSGVGGSLTRAQPKRVASYPVPVAPLNEQKRIADKLDSLLARVDACQTHLGRIPQILKQFRQAVLAAATSGRLTEEWRIKKGHTTETISFDFPDAVSLGDYEFPATWQAVRLKDVAEIMGGITKDTKQQSMADEELPYLRVANVQRGYFDLREIKKIRVPEHRVDDLLLKDGDILFNEGGDIDKLGRGWVWSGEIERCTFQNHVFRARLNEASFIPKYFSYYGNSRGYDYFLQYGKQTTNLASINKTILASLPVAVPPADEQHEIVRRVEALFTFADQLEVRTRSTHEHIEQLTPSILAKAFRGELVGQDDADEDAATLLERIRLARANAPIEVKKPRRRLEMSDTKKYKISLTQALQEIGKTVSTEQLFQAAGYPLDADADLVEEFFVELRTAMRNSIIERKRDGNTDWFSLAQQ
jgi:type I restriction enzyme S subunit